MGNKIIAVIPCFDEAKTIKAVVERCYKHVDMVIVVDNMSRDATSVAAIKGKALALSCQKKGMGSATSAGITWALECNPDFIVTLDGDGQHNPAEIPNLLKPLLEKQTSIVVGIRVYGEMPRYRKFGNDVIKLAYNLGADFKFNDVQCGFRAFTSEVAREIKTKEAGFGCITEFLIRARKYNYKVVGVPVTCIYHKNLNDNSTMNPILHGLSVLFSTIKWRIWETVK